MLIPADEWFDAFKYDAIWLAVNKTFTANQIPYYLKVFADKANISGWTIPLKLQWKLV